MMETIPTTEALPIATNIETIIEDEINENENTGTAGSTFTDRKFLSEEQILELQKEGFTRGLALMVDENIDAFPLRVWIVDNSASMSVDDGHMFLFDDSASNDVKVVPCTRWKEIQETVEYHARIAALLKAPTIFRLLNDPGREIGPQIFGVADRGNGSIEEDLQITLGTIQFVEPAGVTPLCKHIHEIREQILTISSQLEAEGRKVSLVIATDGLPTDDVGIGGHLEAENFVNALQSLEGLPVWITIRLSTDETKVVEFYDELDSLVDLSIEVIDDYRKESKQVHKYNKWFNYTLPLHRCREMGLKHRVFDHLDERRLTFDELYSFCKLILGNEQASILPDPAIDLDGFTSGVKELVKKEKKLWNPIKKEPREIIETSKILDLYKNNACTVS